MICVAVPLVLVAAIAACTPTTPQTPSVPPAPAMPRVDACAGLPAAMPAGFHHRTSRVVASVGKPRHRGIDLIVSASDARQVVEGDLAYSAVGKALEDEDVSIYACRGGAWGPLGAARSDRRGHFALELAGDARLPAGLFDLALVVTGDATVAPFSAFVAPAGTPIAVCDVDGTLTSSENAVVGQVIAHTHVDVHPGAPEALRELANHGIQLVYLTARPERFSELTRRWLLEQGLPRGPVILPPHFTPAGEAAEAAKIGALERLRAIGLALTLGIGNRATDVEAYAHAGIPADHIFVLATQYADELRAPLAEHHAVGFTTYDELRALFAQLVLP